MSFKKLGTLFIFYCCCFISNAQNIYGTIVSKTGVPLQNIGIEIDNKQLAVTDSLGGFSFKKEVAFPFKISFISNTQVWDEQWMLYNNQTFIVNEIKVSEILETVLLSTNYKKESRVLLPTTTISAAQIENANPITLVNAINQTPGVFIQSGAINTNRITIRGVGARTLFGTNKIRAYFNGIPITNGAGETSIDAFNINALTSLEIVKGPKATQYGSNLGGTLLLSTKEPQERGVRITSANTLGSFGLFNNSTTGTYHDDTLSIFANYNHLQLEGYRDNSAYNRNNYLVTTNKKINNVFSLDIVLQHSNNNAQIASSISQSAFIENPRQAAFTWGQAKGFEDNRETLAGASLHTKISDNWSNTTTLFYSYLDHYEPRPFNILDEYTNSLGARTLFAKKIFIHNLKGTITVGAEYTNDRYRWKTIENLYEQNNGAGSLPGALLSNNHENRNQLSIFSTATLPITETLKTELGLHFNKNTYNYNDVLNPAENNKSAQRKFESIVAPNVSVTYNPHHSIALYGNVSRGFNYPSIEETLTPQGMINPEIGPETGWNYEIGTTLSLIDSSLQVHTNTYIMNIKNLLVAQRVGNDQFIGRNAGKTTHRGLEIAINYRYKISEKFITNLYCNGAFNFHKFVDFVDGDDDFSGNDLTGVPNTKITAGATLNFKNWAFATNYRYIGSQPMTDDNTLFSTSYNVMDIKLDYKNIITPSLTFKATAGINNLTNTTYASSILINAASFNGSEPRYFYPGNPINYYTSLQISYHL